jgi:hypothetical protein
MFRSLLVLVSVMLCCPILSHADLFDNARNALNLRASQYDASGISVRGGVHLQAGVPPQSATLLQGQAQVGGGCNFDFGASFREAFENIPQVIEGLVQHLVSAMPMLILCYSSPSACDIAKHWMNYINMLIQARYAQCQSAQHAAMYMGLRLRGGQVSRCLEVRRIAGDTITQAMHQCNNTAFDLRGPDGLSRREVHLLADTLRAAGATPEMQGLARDLMGEVSMQAGPTMGIQSRRPQAALFGRYEQHKHDYATALDTAATELQQTGGISTPTLRAVGVPGQPLPRVALDALAQMRHDPVRYEALVGKMTTGMALTRLTWECNELQNQLRDAAEGNAHLSDEERRAIEKQLETLQYKLAQTVASVDVVEKHYQPALDLLMREYAALQQQAVAVGLRAASVQIGPQRYGRQNPLGYSR